MYFAVTIIFFHPDKNAVRRVGKFVNAFEKILIVDNTPNHDLSYLYEDSKIEYKWMKENKGLSVALEYAIRWASEFNVDYLLTMDQDSSYPMSEIKKMKAYIQDHPGAAIYSANWRKIYWDKKFEKRKAGSLSIPRSQVIETNFSMTSGSWMDVDKARKVLPLENYFISYVDMDISIQLRRMGYKILRIGNSVLCQQVGGKVVGNKINVIFKKLIHAKERYYYMSRNGLFLLEKYGDDKETHRMLCKDRARILFNLIFMEEDRLEKIKYWILGKSAYQEGKLGAYDNV